MDWFNMNFKEFEKLVNSGEVEITLSEDVILDKSEEEIYEPGVDIGVENVVIDGNFHIIDGCGKVSLIYISAPNVTLKNFKFKNGYSEFHGGAIYTKHDLIVENCEFVDNCSDDNGGAIYNDSRLVVKNSKFINNKSDNGGAIYLDENAVLILESSIFKSNSTEFDGGAIYNRSELYVCDSLFERNASFYGGAIYNENKLNVKRCDFKNNIANVNNAIESENNDGFNVSNCNFD